MATHNKIPDFDVIIIGTGISGINFAYRIQESNPELSYYILEARHEIGRTWSLFQYPGELSHPSLNLNSSADLIQLRYQIGLGPLHVRLCIASLDRKALHCS
jgi:cation diffusion facilitator CzcD-associated flavoprotein CzcO